MSTPEALRRFNTHKHFDDTFLPHSVVEVHFNEDSYTVGESEGQVSLSLRITGQFFIPVYAIIEVTDGTATGGTRRDSSRGYYVLLVYMYSHPWYQ